jgi:hypothetical protein
VTDTSAITRHVIAAEQPAPAVKLQLMRGRADRDPQIQAEPMQAEP